MVQINMLPWRERAREIKRKNFFTALGGVVGFALFIIFLFHLYYDDLIHYQEKRNVFLQNEIAQKQMALDKLRVNKEQQGLIQVKLQFLIGLREKSYHAVQLLNELIKTVPDTITLSKLARDGNALTIEGKAQSDLAVAAFLKSISENAFFAQPVLTGISSQQNSADSETRFFQIKVEQREAETGSPVQMQQTEVKPRGEAFGFVLDIERLQAEEKKRTGH